MDLAGEDEHGMGLINMRERAEALNGSFTLIPGLEKVRK